jgi:spore germination cell wall hydrolase CwlJ-like protein
MSLRDRNIFGILLVLAVGSAAAYRGAKQVLKDDDKEIDIMARTMWGEARGEGKTGMQAVANVIMNRVKKGGWWGATPAEVCKKKSQFSCWNKTDPNYYKLIAVNESDPDFRTALTLARSAYSGTLPDITGGATNYLALASLKSIPSWVKGMTKTAQIGNHTFYV